MNSDRKRKSRGFTPAGIIILIAAVTVFCFSAWQLFRILKAYKDADDLYEEMNGEFTTVISAPDDGISSGEPDETGTGGDGTGISGGGDAAGENAADAGDGGAGAVPAVENAAPPLEVDWEKLQSRNPEIIGWLYVDAFPVISYPILHTTDNSKYLHHDPWGNYLYAGSIFMDYLNTGDFADPDTILYGHNMRNGSMFASLKKFKDQSVYDKNPYFWVLTPDGNYRYHIFSVFTTQPESDAYQIYSGGGSDFLAWARQMQKRSVVSNSVTLSDDDRIVILSTCNSNRTDRDVVMGRCCSSERPERASASEIES